MNYKAIFIGKAKDLNIKALWLWFKFGIPLPPLETVDFSKN